MVDESLDGWYLQVERVRVRERVRERARVRVRESERVRVWVSVREIMVQQITPPSPWV